MKKFILLTISLLNYALINAQTGRDVLEASTNHSSNNQILEYTHRNKSINADRGGSTICDSLLAQSSSNNGFEGVMFDIHVLNYVTLETFSIELDPGTPWVGIFYRPGSYVGFNTSSAGWMMLDSAQVTVTTTGIVKIPVDVNLPLLADSNYAFYVTTIDNTSGCNYKDGTAVGNITASDANIQIKEGAGGDYPFSVTNSPRILVGSAYYCQVATEISESQTSANITLQPNPVQNLLNIVAGFKVDKIDITDISGRLILSNNTDKTIDVSQFSNGVYFLKITSNEKQIVEKFIKE